MAKAKKKEPRQKDPLVGKFFHSVKADHETIEWQGEVKARVDDLYLLQLFEWVTGTETNQVTVPVADMAYWRFYDSAEEMGNHYREYDGARALADDRAGRT